MDADPKRAAARLWSEAPCGTADDHSPTKSEQKVRQAIADAEGYAPWLAAAVGLDTARGLDVLDVGCGPGVLLARFALAGARPEGVDLVPEHIAQARACLAAIGRGGEAHVADGERLPYPDARFDRVVANNALQFTTDFDAALREALRVLRPGRDLRLVVYHRRSAFLWGRIVLAHGLGRGKLRRSRPLDELLARSLPWASGDPAFVARSFTGAALARRLVAAGFIDVRVGARGFAWDHLPGAGPLACRVPALRRERTLAALGRAAGWYLSAIARRPPQAQALAPTNAIDTPSRSAAPGTRNSAR